MAFDWDGTLMDSEARILSCMRGAVTDLGLDLPSDEAIRNIIGLGLKEAVTGLFPGADESLIQDLAERYRDHFLAGNSDPSPLFEGVAPLLEELRDAGYLLAVATGKGRRGLDHALIGSGLERLFHATRCADETLSKPHPQMLLELMDELGALPGETLMVGDTEYDMQMARNAGASGLAVSYGVHTVERLMGCEPLGCLNDIRELRDWLGRPPEADAAD